MDRYQVFAMLNGERDYQDKKWNEDTTASGGKHSPAEWLVYMQDYLSEAMHYASRRAEPDSGLLVMATIRKIAAMGVCAMEQNGCPGRELT